MNHLTSNSTEAQDLASALTASNEATETYLQDISKEKARLEALAAARKLVWELETGQEAMLSRMGNLLSTLTLIFMVHLKVPHHIPDDGSISLVELAAKIDADPSFLVRFMRLLCASGIFRETAPNTYAHTKRSKIYCRAEGDFFSVVLGEQLLPAFTNLSGYFSDKALANPDDPKRHPYGWSHNMNDHHWIEVLAREPQNLATFVKSAGFMGNFAADVAIYPFGKELQAASKKAVANDSVLMVDIGGSSGDPMKILRQHYPELQGRIVVQDIPAVINNIPEGHLPEDIEAQVHDFWTPQPIKGAGAYYMRRIMHDWPDEHCQKILRHVVDAMDEESKLLIAEIVIPERLDLTDPSVYWMDLAMFSIAGKERTGQDWRDLFEASGLEMVKIWQNDMKNQAVIEGRKKRT